MRLAIVTRPKPDRDGTLPLYVRLSRGGVKRYVALGIRVPERDWNPNKREVRAGNAHAKRINRILRERLTTAEAAVLELEGRGRHFTADDAKDAVARALHPEPEAEVEDAPGFVAYARAALKAYEARGQVATALAYGSGVNALAAFAGEGLRFEDVTPRLVRAFEGHLTGEQRKRANTVHKYVAGLRTIAARAAQEGVPGAEGAAKALRSVKLRKERAHKERLTFEQVLTLERLDLPLGRMRDARDWFVLAFYLGGMRFVDVALLRWRHVDRAGERWWVRWRQQKTGEGQALPVPDAARAILERWEGRTGPEGGAPSVFVFGLLTEAEARDAKARRARVGSWNALANKNLRAVCARAGVPAVSFHGARNSLADHLRKQGMGVYDIGKALGHTGGIRVTEGYLSAFDAEDLGAKLIRVLSASRRGGGG